MQWKIQSNSLLHYNIIIILFEMGVRCIRPEATVQVEEPVFLYVNMIKMKKGIDIEKHFTFLQKVGKGSFSEVYKVKHKLTNNFYAMKKISKQKNERLQKIIINQFNILKKLDHPNIMKMYDMFQTENHIYIQAELCQGKELFQTIIQNKALQQSKARKIIYDIVCAVRFMHQNHFMHRDLKPENIMYDENSGSLKIIDLGSSTQFADSQIIERKRVGTSYYIAPQVLDRLYNQKCDVWSLGVILYIMLCGEPPFKGKNDSQILERVRKSPLQFKKTIWATTTNEAKHLISYMIERNIAKRKSLDQVIKHNWFNTIIQQKSHTTLNQTQSKSMTECLSNLTKFKDVDYKNLQEGIMTFMVNFVQNNSDLNEMEKCFKTLDLNGDGVLSLQQLTLGLMKYLKASKRQASIIAESIFKKVDKNKSKFIDYSQFLLGAGNLQLIVTDQNLDIAFNYLDEDKSGKISCKELKARLGSNFSEEMYKNMVRKFDADQDGEISKNEFHEMMKLSLNKIQ